MKTYYTSMSVILVISNLAVLSKVWDLCDFLIKRTYLRSYLEVHFVLLKIYLYIFAKTLKALNY